MDDYPMPNFEHLQKDKIAFQKAYELQESDSLQLLGIQLVDAGKGWAKMVLPFSKKLLQKARRVHGGFLATLIDSTVAAAIYPTLKEGEGMTTIDLKVNYIRPVLDHDLVAVSELKHRGRTTVLAECTIWDQETRKQVAFGVALYMLL